MNSQSFIRRELAEVEARGIDVLRHTLRRWDDTIVDPLDQAESRKTRVVLDAGALGMLRAMLASAISRPRAFWSTLALAVRLGRRAGSAGRGIIRHLIYFAEACSLVDSFREAGIDHVHAHFGTNSTTVAALCRGLGGPPYSFTVHGPEEFDAPLGLGLDEKVRRAKFVAAISEYGRSQVRRWVSYDQWPKIRIVRCGLDPMFLETDPGPIPDARRIVCVGRLVEQKGHLTLIEAAARLHAEGVEFELILVGDGPLRGEIERLIAANRMEGRVRLTGWQSTATIRDLIRDCRATVLSSFAEGLPVVIMESLALRRPVISTYVAGIPELVEPGVTGWLVPASSAEALAEALREALDAPVEELERMGAAGAARVAQRHRASTEAGKLVALFRGEEAVGEPLSPVTA
ncbi:glycosyltransferase [Aquisphaera insulae]|uniref:glycosyltransferase n=1 Tax=Aquisphaera insulae TaxID=2712864 RepID=UPI0013E9C348